MFVEIKIHIMKNLKNVLLLLTCISALMITSCKKEGCTDSTAKNYSSKADKDDGSCVYEKVTLAPFTAKVEGAKFVHTSLTAVEEPAFGMQVNVINIKASKGNEYIQLKIPVDLSVGTYTFDSGTLEDGISGIYESGMTSFGSISGLGSLEIVTKSEGKISGTFNFTGEPFMTVYENENREITEGQFNVEYE